MKLARFILVVTLIVALATLLAYFIYAMQKPYQNIHLAKHFSEYLEEELNDYIIDYTIIEYEESIGLVLLVVAVEYSGGYEIMYIMWNVPDYNTLSYHFRNFFGITHYNLKFEPSLLFGVGYL